MLLETETAVELSVDVGKAGSDDETIPDEGETTGSDTADEAEGSGTTTLDPSVGPGGPGFEAS